MITALAVRIKDKKFLHLSLIALLTALSYSNSFNNSFHFDDRYVIIEDNAIKDIANLPSILTDVFSRPLSRATFALNYYFGGMDVWGYHLVNTIFHIIVSMEVYLLAGALREKIRPGNKGEFPVLAALVFALHPLTTGSVTYIASRSTVLAAVFVLLSLLLFIRALSAQAPGKRRLLHIGAFMSFIAGMGVKEIAVIALPALLIYTFIEHTDGIKAWLKKYGAVFLMWFSFFPVYALARYIFLPDVLPVDIRIEEGILARYPYFLTELNVVVFHYLKWLVFPLGGPNIDPDIPAETTLMDFSTITAIIIIALLIASALFLKKRHGVISFSILWYFAALIPTGGIFPLGDVAVERHVYISLVGFALFSGYALERAGNALPRRAAMALYAAIFISLTYLTFQRNYVWKNEMTLWDDAAKIAPDKLRVLNNRAWGHFLAGDTEGAERLYKELLNRFPPHSYPYAYNNLGFIYETKGDMAGAIAQYEDAVRTRPRTAVFRTNLAIALDKAGLYDRAIEEFKISLALSPKNTEALVGLSSSYAKKSIFPEAISAATAALKLEPKNPMAHYMLGYSYEQTGDIKGAKTEYETAVRLAPGWNLPAERLAGLR